MARSGIPARKDPTTYLNAVGHAIDPPPPRANVRNAYSRRWCLGELAPVRRVLSPGGPEAPETRWFGSANSPLRPLPTSRNRIINSLSFVDHWRRPCAFHSDAQECQRRIPTKNRMLSKSTRATYMYIFPTSAPHVSAFVPLPTPLLFSDTAFRARGRFFWISAS